MLDFSINIDDPISKLKKLFIFFHSRWGLLLSLIIINISFALLFHTLELSYILLFIPNIIWIIFWFYMIHIPKAKRNSIGFALAISIENEADKKQLTNDFEEIIRRSLENEHFRYPFSFVPLSTYHINKIKNDNIAIDYMAKTKCQFMIYGNCRTRTVDGKEQYFIEIKAMVSHKPIPKEMSNFMSHEFGEIFPQKIQVEKEQGLFLLEKTSGWIEIASKYMVGVAALISNNYNYAESILENIYNKKTYKAYPNSAKIEHCVREKLCYVYSSQIDILIKSWRKKHHADDFIKTKPYLDKWSEIYPNDYKLKNIKAMYYFVIEHNTKLAKNELVYFKKKDLTFCGKKIKSDLVWLYNLAFLYAYDMHLSSARSYYDKVFKCKSNNNNNNDYLFEVEEFLCWILKEEPTKKYLYFCLGLINYYEKKDLTTAESDFKNFIKTVPKDKFKKQVEEAKKIINKINQSSTDEPR